MYRWLVSLGRRMSWNKLCYIWPCLSSQGMKHTVLSPLCFLPNLGSILTTIFHSQLRFFCTQIFVNLTSTRSHFFLLLEFLTLWYFTKLSNWACNFKSGNLLAYECSHQQPTFLLSSRLLQENCSLLKASIYTFNTLIRQSKNQSFPFQSLLFCTDRIYLFDRQSKCKAHRRQICASEQFPFLSSFTKVPEG